jgi:hypothetical protein
VKLRNNQYAILEMHEMSPEDEARARNYLTKHAPDVLPILMPEDSDA